MMARVGWKVDCDRLLTTTRMSCWWQQGGPWNDELVTERGCWMASTGKTFERTFGRGLDEKNGNGFVGEQYEVLFKLSAVKYRQA